MVSPRFFHIDLKSFGMKVPPPQVKGAASSGRRCRLLGSKVPPPQDEGAASSGRRCRLLRSIIMEYENKKKRGKTTSLL